jgi:hypothetical protein
VTTGDQVATRPHLWRTAKASDASASSRIAETVVPASMRDRAGDEQENQRQNGGKMG